MTTVNRSSTSGPRRDTEGDVIFREEQQDGGGHGTKCKPIGPTITEAAYSIQRPGINTFKAISLMWLLKVNRWIFKKSRNRRYASQNCCCTELERLPLLFLLTFIVIMFTHTTMAKRPFRKGSLWSMPRLLALFWRNESTPVINTWKTQVNTLYLLHIQWRLLPNLFGWGQLLQWWRRWPYWHTVFVDSYIWVFLVNVYNDNNQLW